MNVASIENTFMLEHYKRQRNYHSFVDYLGERKKVVTFKGSPSFVIKQKKGIGKGVYLLTIFFASLLVLVFLLFKGNKKTIVG